MSKFNPGDILILINDNNKNARIGDKALVYEPATIELGSNDPGVVFVKWMDLPPEIQMDGGYYEKDFELHLPAAVGYNDNHELRQVLKAVISQLKTDNSNQRR